MPRFTRARVLIVAQQTSDSADLRQAVAARADQGGCTFTLLVPASSAGLRRVGDPRVYGNREAERRLSLSLPLLSLAAGAEVVGVVGSPDPFIAVREALKLLGFDEVIVSMLPLALSRWRRADLPERIRALGVPVTEVVRGDPDFEPLPAA